MHHHFTKHSNNFQSILELLSTYLYANHTNQRINGPVNAHLISGLIQNLDKMAEKTLTRITNNPQLTHSVYNINLISGHRMQ